MERIDDAISSWTCERFKWTRFSKTMETAEVPAGRIYSAADIAADPHFAARGMIEEVIAGDGEPLKVPGIVPKLSATPGAIRSPAPEARRAHRRGSERIGLQPRRRSRS